MSDAADEEKELDKFRPRRGASALAILRKLRKHSSQLVELKAPALKEELERRPDVRRALLYKLELLVSELEEAREYIQNATIG